MTKLPDGIVVEDLIMLLLSHEKEELQEWLEGGSCLRNYTDKLSIMCGTTPCLDCPLDTRNSEWLFDLINEDMYLNGDTSLMAAFSELNK
jgi:hypothetical protein